MEEEEHTDRKQQLAALYQKLNKIKKSLNEGIQKYSFQGCILLVSHVNASHHDILQLFQMTQTTLTRSSAPTHLSRASPI